MSVNYKEGYILITIYRGYFMLASVTVPCSTGRYAMIRAFARLLPNACVNDRGRRRTKFSARALSDLRPAAKTSGRKLIAQRSVNCVIMVEQLMGT